MVTGNPPLHQSDEVDKQFLNAPIKSPVDKYQLVPEFLKVRGLVKEHLDSFNYFVKTGIKKIVSANDTIRSKSDPNVYLRYEDVWIGKPSVVVDGVTESLKPQTCRLSDRTYAAPIYVNIKYCNGVRSNNGNLMEYKKKNVIIGRLPIMLRSCCCVLYGKDDDELANLGPSLSPNTRTDSRIISFDSRVKSSAAAALSLLSSQISRGHDPATAA